ncbi:MAG: tetratricopeptide repeat protein [Alphaproteobacteria bacterium]|nr:tetratricopeptide repeat protein [Alphaproteobacteria bacterium]
MDKADELVARGADRHRQGRIEEAESLYRRGLRLNPNHPDALNLLGVALRQRGRLTEALPLAARAAALLPGAANVQANYGAALAEAGQLPEAIARMQAALNMAPDDAMTWRNLGQAMMAGGAAAAALGPLDRAVALAPTAPEAWLALAHARRESGDAPGARVAAQRVLELARRAPALAENARFLLAALGEGTAPDRAPAGYVRELFDQFAPRFDAELEGALHYRTPALLAEALRQVGAAGAVLDLGCGTGLSGVALKPLARRLEGVDLSPRMLDAARVRGVYDALHEADLLAFLPRRRAAWEVIAAADVLNYLGDLAPALAAMRLALKPGGTVAFSIESGDTAPFALGEGLRFRHAPAHVAGLAEGAGFAVLANTRCTLREEKGTPVAGALLVLR